MSSRLSGLFDRIRANGAMIDYRFGIGRLERLFFSKWFNPFATFWLNFRSFPFCQAILFPVFVYGRPRMFALSGRMRVDGKVRPGMIRFNSDAYGAPSNMGASSEIINLGEILFKGGGFIGTGNKIKLAQRAVLVLGNKFRITDQCNISCEKRIEIGDESWIIHRSQVMDTNFHFVADLETMKVAPRSKPIKIGRHCWVSNTAIVMGGTVMPDYSILGSMSMINKDYSDCAEGTFFAGVPARPRHNRLCRIDNLEIEKAIWIHFASNRDDFPLDGFSIEDF